MMLCVDSHLYFMILPLYLDMTGKQWRYLSPVFHPHPGPSPLSPFHPFCIDWPIYSFTPSPLCPQRHLSFYRPFSHLTADGHFLSEPYKSLTYFLVFFWKSVHNFFNGIPCTPAYRFGFPPSRACCSFIFLRSIAHSKGSNGDSPI